MSNPIIVVGDDINIPVTLKKNGVVFAINGSAVVKARFISTDHLLALCADTTQSNATSGANWSASLVVIVFPAATTATIEYQGEAVLEIQVDDSGKTTWFTPVTITRGLVV